MIYKKISQKDFDEAEDAYENCLKKRKKEQEPAEHRKEKASRSQYTGLLLSVLIIIYSYFSEDVPGFFFGLSFCIWMMRYFTDHLFGNRSEEAASLLRALSITLFFGSIVLLFL